VRQHAFGTPTVTCSRSRLLSHPRLDEQRTPEHIWQARWLGHPNGATGLTRVELCVADPAEAVARFARYTGLPVGAFDGAPALATARGGLVFRDPVAIRKICGFEPPGVPWIAGYALSCTDLARAPAGRESASGRVVVPSAALGGVLFFEA
jgi:hypothetical protein